MWEAILNQALNNSLWAALFVALMVYLLRDTAKRENGYKDMIGELHGSVRIIKDVQVAIKEICSSLIIMNKDLTEIKTKIRIKDEIKSVKAKKSNTKNIIKKEEDKNGKTEKSEHVA